MALSTYLAVLVLVLFTFALVGVWETPILGFLQRRWPGLGMRVDSGALLLAAVLLLDAFALLVLLRTAVLVP